jgi:hypothetical protein
LGGALMALSFAAGRVTAADSPSINEFSASTTGTDVEYLEIFGSPSSDYSDGSSGH